MQEHYEAELAELKEDLAQAQAMRDTNTARVAFRHKKEIEKMTSFYEKKLMSCEKKTERLQRRQDDDILKMRRSVEEDISMLTEFNAAKKEVKVH